MNIKGLLFQAVVFRKRTRSDNFFDLEDNDEVVADVGCRFRRDTFAMKLLSVQDTKSQKTFIANLTFDYYRSLYRSPLFLNRNIMRVLAHHDKRRQNIPNPPGESSESPNTAPADRSSRSAATRSLRDRFRPVYHERDAEFIVELIDVRKKLNFK